ncbi:tail completion protein gp17 [Rhodobacter lacus]|uniref:DUF3168 domain-containing protein n=1 Tax=Rhodobacter lacus TaxID=1641972 RepID=A0ABW5AC36_9RHOB
MQQALRALLGTVIGAEKIAWGRLPQGTALPAVVLHLIDHVDGMTMQGPDGLWRGRVQVDCYAPGYDDAEALARAVIARLHGYRGGGFRGILLVARRDDDEPGASDRPVRVSMDFLTNWREGNG